MELATGIMRPDGACTLVLEPTSDFGCKVMCGICTGHVPTIV